jgi:hypothetical protein
MTLELLRDLLDGNQATIPLCADGIEAACGCAELSAEHSVAQLAPHPHRFDQAHVLEDGEMFGYCLPSNREPLGESRGGGLALAECAEDAPPRLIAECSKHWNKSVGGHDPPSR